MANYYGTVRTNYFKVTDEEKYQEIFSNLTAEESIEDFTEKTDDGELLHGFGSYSTIDYCNEDDEDDDGCGGIDRFIELLQPILADGEVFIYQEVGNEKLRYLIGLSVIVTKDKIEYVDITQTAKEMARKMLGNPSKDVRLEY